MRVMELGGRLRLVTEPRNLPLIEHGRKWQNLERDFSVERLLVGLVNDPHSAAAHFANNAVFADMPPAGHDRIRFARDCFHARQIARRPVQQPQTFEVRPKFTRQIGVCSPAAHC